MSDERGALQRLFDSMPGVSPLSTQDEAAYGPQPQPDDLIGRLDRNLYRLLRKPLPEPPRMTDEQSRRMWDSIMNFRLPSTPDINLPTMSEEQRKYLIERGLLKDAAGG